MSPDRRETLDEPSLEERVLVKFGLGHRLDEVVGTAADGSPVTARHFHDAYRNNAEALQRSKEYLAGCETMSEDDPDFTATQRDIADMLDYYKNRQTGPQAI